MSPRAAARLERFGFPDVYDYAAGKSDWMAFGLPVEGEIARVPRAGTLARRDVPTCRPLELAGTVFERVSTAGWDICVVVDGGGVVHGLVELAQLTGSADFTVEAVMELGPSTFRPSAELAQVVRYMRRHDRSAVPITTPDGRLVGLVRRVDTDHLVSQ